MPFRIVSETCVPTSVAPANSKIPARTTAPIIVSAPDPTEVGRAGGGARTSLVGSVGKDWFGELALRTLQEAGVDVSDIVAGTDPGPEVNPAARSGC